MSSAARRLSPADQLAHTAEQRRLRLTLTEALPPPSAPGPITPSQQRARHAYLVAGGLDPLVARHLVLAETKAGSLGPTSAAREVAHVSRQPGAHYGPVADLPAAPKAWRWADVLDALPPDPPARPAGIPDPLKRTR